MFTLILFAIGALAAGVNVVTYLRSGFTYTFSVLICAVCLIGASVLNLL